MVQMKTCLVLGHFSEMMDPMDCDEDAHLPDVDGAGDGSQDRDVGKSVRDEVRNIIFTWNLRKENDFSARFHN